MKIKKLGLVLYVLLLLWFTLDLIGIPGLVTRDDWLSAAGLLELGLVIILIGHLRQWKFAPFLSLAMLGLWGYLQFVSHWYGFFFKIPADRLQRYYSLFSGTFRFFPESKTRLIPDAYHTLLGLLLAVNLVWVAIQIVWSFHRRRTQHAVPTN